MDIGITKTEYLHIEEPIELDCGKSLRGVDVAYETYGTLNENKDNAILVLHALTGDAHAAGVHEPRVESVSCDNCHKSRTELNDSAVGLQAQPKPTGACEGATKRGWWDNMIGPGKAFDTNKFFVVCSNMLGGCSGTTGPCSINPDTGKTWGLDFPVITIEDTVKVQKKLTDYLGIKKLTVAGGSMGGMQAIEWNIAFPEMVRNTIIIASTSRLSAQGIAFNAVGRNAILSDPYFNGGDYYGKENQPEKGLSIARMVGHITYLSEDAMHSKFARKFQDKDKPDFDFNIEFQVESYLAHQGQIFVDRFDANSYLYITKACDYYDVTTKFGSLEKAFEKTNSKFLIMSFSSDWLFPTNQSKEIVNSLMRAGKDVSFLEINSPAGHDAFLLEFDSQTKVISSFL